MGNGYLCHLTFIFKFILKNFLFLEIAYDTMVSPSIFLFLDNKPINSYGRLK